MSRLHKLAPNRNHHSTYSGASSNDCGIPSKASRTVFGADSSKTITRTRFALANLKDCKIRYFSRTECEGINQSHLMFHIQEFPQTTKFHHQRNLRITVKFYRQPCPFPATILFFSSRSNSIDVYTGEHGLIRIRPSDTVLAKRVSASKH